MGRLPVTLQAKHPIAELKAHYQNTTNAVERRRAHVIWLLASGKPRSEVIDLTAYSLPSVLEAIHRYNNEGLEGLRDQRESNSGAPPLLNNAELLLLAQTIRHDFEQSIVWRDADVQTWVESTLGKQVRYQRAFTDSVKSLHLILRIDCVQQRRKPVRCWCQRQERNPCSFQRPLGRVNS